MNPACKQALDLIDKLIADEQTAPSPYRELADIIRVDETLPISHETRKKIGRQFEDTVKDEQRHLQHNKRIQDILKRACEGH